MNAEPIPAERLAAIRRLDLATLMPQSDAWTLATRMQAGRWLQQLKPVLHELLDEIATQDEELHRADAEVERLTKLLPPAATGRPSAIRIERTATGWRTRWREGSKRRSQSWDSRAKALGHAEFLKHLAWKDGAL